MKEQESGLKRIIDDLFAALTKSVQVYLTETTYWMSYLKAVLLRICP